MEEKHIEQLPAYAERAKAELEVKVREIGWEGFKRALEKTIRAWQRFKKHYQDVILKSAADNSREYHLYRYCKKKRVRKKYKNRLIKEFNKIAKADECEADE